MRFILKAILSLVIVGAFMPGMDNRDMAMPELHWNRGEAVSQSGKICERSESVCDALSQSAILADVAGAAAKTSFKRAVEAFRDSEDDGEAAAQS